MPPEPSSSACATSPAPEPTSSWAALLERHRQAMELQTQTVVRLCDLLQVLTHQNALLIEMLVPTDDDDEEKSELEKPQYLSQRPGRG